MFYLKITMPTYLRDTYKNLHGSGEIQVSAEVDVLSEGYSALKAELNELLRRCEAENEIVADLAELSSQVDLKTKTLKRLKEDIVLAKNQLQRLQAFLRHLGINPNDYRLDIDNTILQPTLQITATEEKGEEIDPIPFDSSESSSEF